MRNLHLKPARVPEPAFPRVSRRAGGYRLDLVPGTVDRSTFVHTANRQVTARLDYDESGLLISISIVRKESAS